MCNDNIKDIVTEVRKNIDPKFKYLLRNVFYIEFLEDIVNKTIIIKQKLDENDRN